MVKIVGKNEEKENNPSMFFTVTVAQNKGYPVHILVRAESALDALTYVQKKETRPVVSVHITEYSQYYDLTLEKDKEESTENNDCDCVEECTCGEDPCTCNTK